MTAITPYHPIEILEIADRVEQLTKENTSCIEELQIVFPGLLTRGYDILAPYAARLMTVLKLSLQFPMLFFTEKHPPHVMSEVEIFSVAVRTADQLDDSIVLNYFSLPGICWLTIGQLHFVSDRYNESELSDRLLEKGSNPFETAINCIKIEK